MGGRRCPFHHDRRNLWNALWGHNPIKRELDQATRVRPHSSPHTSNTGTPAEHLSGADGPPERFLHCARHGCGWATAHRGRLDVHPLGRACLL